MFRVLAVLAISIFFSSTAVAHDDWHGRHHHRHFRDDVGYGYNPYYRGYAVPPRMGYYPAPPQYYGLPPVRGFSYRQPIPMPRFDRHARGGW